MKTSNDEAVEVRRVTKSYAFDASRADSERADTVAGMKPPRSDRGRYSVVTPRGERGRY
jgi:hypothetical protein